MQAKRNQGKKESKPLKSTKKTHRQSGLDSGWGGDRERLLSARGNARNWSFRCSLPREANNSEKKSKGRKKCAKGSGVDEGGSF